MGRRLIILAPAFFLAWRLVGAEDQGEAPLTAEQLRSNTHLMEKGSNSASFVNVTVADGVFVVDAVTRGTDGEGDIARRNTERIHEILTSPAIGAHCTFYFPAGEYLFDGAVDPGAASIESTASHQSFVGDGVNSTRIRQSSTTVPATIRIRHTGCSVENLSVTSADRDRAYRADWDADRHQTAIHLDAPNDNWYCDPRILNVNINTTQNNIVFSDYYRPFNRGIEITGPWLNVYARTIWMRDVMNAIYINQGERIAGPAKFIEVNAYATPPTHSKSWNIFFKSEGHFMEQVELIHCTYIGSQFIYMDGAKPSPGMNPVYNMIIDHNYINTDWLRDAEGVNEASKSGVYLNLPPLADGSNCSRDIRFTNNSCTAKAPRRGGFFYVEGSLYGLAFVENDVQCAGGDKCVYIRASQPMGNSDVAIKDIRITGNYFRQFRNPITVGGDLLDPSRMEFDYDARYGGKHKGAYDGKDEDPFWNERVVISGNQSFNLPVVEKNLLSTCYVNHCRKVTITSNNFVDTDGFGFVVRASEDVVVSGNTIGGFGRSESRDGIRLIDCVGGGVTGNTVRKFQQGIHIEGCENISLGNNVITETHIGIVIEENRSTTIGGNTISQCVTGLVARDVRDASISGNLITRAETPVMLDGLRNTTLVGNRFSGEKDCVLGESNQGLLVRSNLGLSDDVGPVGDQ